MDAKLKKVYDSLSAQCARREYCTSEVMRKAADRLDGDREAASGIVATLKEEGFVSDLRYACAFAREKASLQGWGPVKIRYALSAKGISLSDADAAMEEVDKEKAGEKLRRLLEVKRKSLEGDPQMKLKLLKYALSRGYEYEQVKRFVDDPA